MSDSGVFMLDGDEALMNGVVIGIIIAVLTMMVRMKLKALERRLDRLSTVDAKLDALLKNAGIRFDPFQDVPPGVREALAQGRRIDAIKQFREATGVGLKAAKEHVDELHRRSSPAPRH